MPTKNGEKEWLDLGWRCTRDREVWCDNKERRRGGGEFSFETEKY